MNFLLGVGVEEIPDWMIVPALDHVRGAFEKLLADHNLTGAVAWIDATPRRFVLRADGLPERQQDREDLLTGPPKSSGAGAAQGFARKNGVTVEELETVSTPKGDYFAFRKKIVGRLTRDILAENLPTLILGIPWPKTMYWSTKGSARFIRPIRRIVCLLGDEVVPFEIAGVKTGNLATGHRRFGKFDFPVTVDNIVDQLRENHVLLQAVERRNNITTGIAKLLEGTGLHLKADPGLLDKLTYLTEWPTPILGSFDPAYLTLPEEVLVTVMRHHQNYFSLTRPDGSLAPNFIAVMNIPADLDGFVVRGNERVLRARFNDARFFYDTDQKHQLTARVDDLAKVTFQAKLGSYLDKTHRVVALIGQLGGDTHAQRAALLAKCDLTTDMVKEFTDLQGIVGGLYARAQGESQEAADAIYDQYKPLNMEDTIPRTAAGRFLSLADKLDTLRECFRIGMVPKGSSDPFALRRAAQGVVKILVEDGTAIQPHLNGSAQLEEFLLDRVRYYFREIRGFAYDEVNAVLAAGWDPLRDAAERLAALHAVRPTANFEPLAASFKRIKNILAQAGFTGGPAIDPRLLEDGAERNLYTAANTLELGAGYREDLEKIASLRPAVDLFFDKVLVNAEDPLVRQNRLVLLHSILTRFSSIAGFSEIVTS